MRPILSILAALLPVLSLCAQTFSEVALASGINISYGDGNQGGGVSFADFNGDGSDDLTFTSAAGLPLYFYRNNGNGTFTSLNLVNNFDESKEAIWVDYDNDGDQDLYVTVFNGVSRLYRNEGGLNMTDVTMSAFGSLTAHPTFGAVWGDYDRDGWLDLYVCRYVSGITNINRLYRNNGNGTFTDISDGSASNDGSKLSFDACFLDVNNDNWQEIYVANDRPFFANSLYLNQLGTYAQDPGGSANIAIDAMNAGGADYDNDGDMDLYVSNTSEGNALLQNDGFGNFTDVAGATGTGVFQETWASNFFDYDNDLDLDLYVSSINFFQQNWANAFLVNEGDGTFSNNLAATGGLGGSDTGLSYGHAMGDLNNDGKLDIAVSQETDNNLLWRNDESSVGNYLRVRLTGTTSNADGIGARVVAQVGNQILTRYRHGSQGYLSQHSQSLHFGLGSNTQIDNIQVFWPSGIVDSYDNITSINQLMGLTEGETVLPLVLTAFAVKTEENHNYLDWTTSRENNTSHFEIERSVDGQNFLEIGRVMAAGNSQSVLSYEFLDDDFKREVAYYRLKMLDKDDSFTYSEVRRVVRSKTASSMLVRLGANPASHSSINVISEAGMPADNYELKLYDINGTLVRQGILTTDGSTRGTYTFAAGLMAGNYVLKVGGNGRSEYHQLIVH
ncbi:hypothetical protein CEQ90_03980 [Lewinellaceae bacterium SD302]|nr:hypothetical protein CEQ90_03980 [Lewinellaceae bacterium SD302]